jgi:hypothetical protein
MKDFFGPAPRLIYPMSHARHGHIDGKKVGKDENLRDGYNIARKDETNIQAREEWECPEYGALCNLGSCNVVYRIDRN